MNMFDKDLGLDLLINKKKVGSDVASLVSGSGDSGSVIDIDSDAGSIKSINIKPSVVDVREHMQPSRQHMGYNGRQNDYEEESDAYESNSQSGSDGTGGTEGQSMQGYPTNNYNQQYNNQPQRRMMSEEEIINAKREILYQFERMERKGMQLPRKFTMASTLEEMRLELDRLKKDREIDQSVKFQRKVMMTVVTGMELLNNKFDPVGARLDGWSESINDNIDDYDEVFEELHDKYKGKAKMAPEFKLMFMLGGSAFMFHMTNTMFKTQMPGLDQVLKQNPELMRQFAAATASTMQQNTAETNPMMSGISGMFSNMFGGNSGQQASAPQRPPQAQPQYAPPQQASRPNMTGPSNVDDILREIERENMNDRVEMMSTITQSELSELGDDASINGLLMNKRGKGGKKGLNLDI
jgi:hypothetical protein